MKVLKQVLSIAALGAALGVAMAGCGGGGGGPPAMAGGTGGTGGAGGAGPMKVQLVDWVTDLAVSYAPDTSPPDTVEDKVDIVIDTSDPAAFDPLLQPPQP
jgi:hypothetical protein